MLGVWVVVMVIQVWASLIIGRLAPGVLSRFLSNGAAYDVLGSPKP